MESTAQLTAQHPLLWPIAAMAALTLLVLAMVPVSRLIAIAVGRAHISDFRLGDPPNVPNAVVHFNRNYLNLLQLPVLFYVACILLIVLGREDPQVVRAAWLFVGLRAVHSLVHVTVNYVPIRFVSFFASTTALVALWKILLF